MYEEVIEKLYKEYDEFKSQEISKSPEKIFQDAFTIAGHEVILSHYETTLLEREESLLNFICQKGIATPRLLKKTYEYSLGNINILMDEEDFNMFLEEELLG